MAIHTSFIDLRKCRKNTNWTIVLNIWLVFLFSFGKTSAAFKLKGKFELNKVLLKLWHIKWEKRSLFDLINFTGISCSWHVFLPSNLFISLEIFGLSTNSKEKFKSFSFMQFLILKILGWFSYFPIAFNTWSSILYKFDSSSGTCSMPSLLKILLKKIMKCLH